MQVTVVPTAVLRVASVYHTYGSQLGKQVNKLSEQRHIKQAEGRQTIGAAINGSIEKCLRLCSVNGYGFLHNHIVTGLYGLNGILVVYMVGVGYINKIGLRLLQHPCIIGKHKSCGCIGLTKVYGVFDAFLAREDACYLYSSCKFVLKHFQHLFNYFARSGYANLHCLIRITWQITEINRRKTTETGKKTETNRKIIRNLCLHHP